MTSESVLPMNIVEAVAAESGWPIERILSSERHRSVSHARHVVMWFVRREGFSYPDIAQLLQRADHSTARHGVGKIDLLLMDGDKYTQDLVANVQRRLEQQ